MAWGEIARVFTNEVTFVSAIAAKCDINKLIKTVTQDPTTLISTMAARVGGGFILEIPSKYAKMKTATSCKTLMKEVGRVFSIIFDYYI
jgi:pyrroline-5-carboxylate reductase